MLGRFPATTVPDSRLQDGWGWVIRNATFTIVAKTSSLANPRASLNRDNPYTTTPSFIADRAISRGTIVALRSATVPRWTSPKTTRFCLGLAATRFPAYGTSTIEASISLCSDNKSYFVAMAPSNYLILHFLMKILPLLIRTKHLIKQLAVFQQYLRGGIVGHLQKILKRLITAIGFPFGIRCKNYNSILFKWPYLAVAQSTYAGCLTSVPLDTPQSDPYLRL